MSKASAAIRRSGVRLRSLGSGHTHLKLLISEQSSARQRHKDLLSTQTSLSCRLDKWSQAEENPAIQDILHQVHDLNLMWIEAQKEYIVALKEYKKVYENILSVEKKLDGARKHLAACEEKEKKLNKELIKGPKDVALTQEKLKQATDSVQLAEAEVSGQKRETEAVKLMSVRAGLLDMSQAWEALGNKCALLAQAQKELATLIPDIGSSRVQEMPPYDGTRESTRIMVATKAKVDQMAPPPYAAASTYTLPSAPRKDSSLTRRNLDMLHTLDSQEAEYNSFEDSYDESEDYR